jgi:predicted nucleotidyltransferase
MGHSEKVAADGTRGSCYYFSVALYDELRSVLNALDQAGVDYALVGGLAVAVWGAPRATRDIDLLVRSEALAEAMSAVRGRGFTLPALPFEFKDGSTLQRVNRVDEAGNLMTVDFMLVDRNLESAWASRTRVPFADGEVTVVSREALMAMKAQAARPQDLADIQNLKEGDR